MHILFYFARISLKVIEFWLSENFDKGFTSTFQISFFLFIDLKIYTPCFGYAVNFIILSIESLDKNISLRKNISKHFKY